MPPGPPMKRTVYFDHAATTPLHPDALEAMLPYLRDRFGNPSGAYALGRQAAGTESINLAIKGVAFAQKLAGLGDHIVTAASEHHAVLHSCEYLSRFGFETTFLPVDATGMVSPQAVAEAVSERTVLVSLMLANNEAGTRNPAAGAAARGPG